MFNRLHCTERFNVCIQVDLINFASKSSSRGMATIEMSEDVTVASISVRCCYLPLWCYCFFALSFFLFPSLSRAIKWWCQRRCSHDALTIHFWDEIFKFLKHLPLHHSFFRSFIHSLFHASRVCIRDDNMACAMLACRLDACDVSTSTSTSLISSSFFPRKRKKKCA